MKKIIRYFSAKDFKKFMKSYGYISFNHNRNIPIKYIEDEDFAIISIGNFEEYNEVDNDIDLWVNGCNNHWLPNCKNVLNIDFDDVDNFGVLKFRGALNDEVAKDIVNFIFKNENKNNFFIHCSAGISRSGAVASVIYDYFKSLHNDVEIYPKYPDTPNIWVKNIIKKSIFDTYDNAE